MKKRRSILWPGLAVFAYWPLSLAVCEVTNRSINRVMAWNVFLAFLPLCFSAAIQALPPKRGLRPLVWLLGLGWLLLFPNAPYLLTDLVNTMRFLKYPTERDITAWLSLMHVAVGILLGLAVGLRSLYDIHRKCLKNKKLWMAHGGLCVVCLLSGYGIYIGRFLRFNSWDIFRPVMLARFLLEDFSIFTVLFSLLMALCTLLAYWIACMLFSKE